MSSLIIHVFYLLWRNFKSLSPHIHFLVDIDTGDNEEDPGAPGSSCQQPAQSEDDGPLVLLDHLDYEEEREWHGGDDDQDRDDREELTKQAGSLLTDCNHNTAVRR